MRMAVQGSHTEDLATLLLVHGGWGGAWIWEPVLPSLGEKGVRAEMIERLPSAGDDPAELGDLHADAEHVRERISDIAGPVVLCGHSYGGMVITEVADEPSISESIYLAAFWPSAGQSLLDLVGEGPLPDWIVDRGDGSLMVTEDVGRARQALFAHLDPDSAAQAHRELVLQAASSFATPSGAPRCSHPTTYVLCSEDEAIPIAAQEEMSASADATIRLKSDHCPQLSHPEEVAEALARAVVGRQG
jgi:pimeloyl-ACP methyl ester carboxylesterase